MFEHLKPLQYSIEKVAEFVGRIINGDSEHPTFQIRESRAPTLGLDLCNPEAVMSEEKLQALTEAGTRLKQAREMASIHTRF